MLFIKVKKEIVYFIILVISKCFQNSAATNTDCPVDKPDWSQQKANKNFIVDWLLDKINNCKNSEVEYPGYDGWFHNLAKTDLGSNEQPLLRGWPALRIDGSQEQNWSETWNTITSNGSVFKTNTNALLLFTSKEVIDEILNTKMPFSGIAEYLYPTVSHNTEQINYATPYIDGGMIYGRSRPFIMKQIVSEDGTIDINGLFDLEIKYEEISYLSISSVLRIIWIRWHNNIAKRIHEICPKWTSEKVFNEARKWTIAVQQRIYAYEWLPLWTSRKLENYLRYDPTVDPQGTKLFQASVAIPQLIKSSNFRKPVENDFIGKLLKNLTLIPWKNFAVFKEVEYMQQKYNLPDINHARKVFKLSPYTNWENFLTRNNIKGSRFISTLAKQKFQRIDAMIGGTLESIYGAGELFTTVIYDQFRRIRDGDRFWFENRQNNLFSCEEMVKIGQITFADVISTVTNVDLKHKENSSVFTFSDQDNLLSVPVYSDQKTNTFEKSLNTLFFPSIYFYIFPFILMGFICFSTFGIAFCLILRQRIKIRDSVKKESSVTKQALEDDWQMPYPLFPVKEYIGAKEGLRKVVVILKKDRKQILIQSFSGTVLRVIDFNGTKATVKVINLSDEPTLIIQLPHNYDLVLKFESNYLRNAFTTELDIFIANNSNLEKELITNFNWKAIKTIIVTKEKRQMWLEMFFRVAFAQAFKIQHSLHEMLQVDAFVAKEVIYTELTIFEFADALNMHPDNEFVKRMFTLVDKDKNGFISFREFADLIIIFAEGSTEKKAKLLFDLYDINGTGLIPAKDFSSMIRFFLETVGGRVYDVNVERTITVMLRSAGAVHKNNLDFNDFKKIIGDDIKNLSYANLGFKMQKQDDANSYLAVAKRTIEAMYGRNDDLETRFQSFTRSVDQKQAETIRAPVKQTSLYYVLLYFELHSTQIFWMTFLTLLIVILFILKIDDVNLNNKLSGINWYIFGITRAAKYAMVLTYALLFSAICKNIWTKLRDVLSNKYFPFDSLVQIHIYLAYLSGVFTAIHAIGEILIFYKLIFISDDLSCSFNGYLMNHETFKIHLMFWLNHVVITGFTLTVLLFFVYVFAWSYIRQKLDTIFYFSHNLYPVIVIIIIIHGSQSPSPLIYSVMSGPLILLLLDIFVSLKRKKIELPVLRAEFLPSSVICLVIRRPENFQYKVGQWVRLAVPQISRRKFHSVSLSVAPHEPNLRIYIRPTSPWAHQVYSLFEGPGSGYAAAPVRVLLDGPYGGGAHHWRIYDVVVLVGGDSGVASFAAILKDVSYALQMKEYLHCQKVYFLWVAKTQKHFEWMVDLIQEIENNDQKHYISFHTFITQFYEKFDLRTIMLYICEKHYQRISGKSLFTNLRAVTHFGQPAFPKFFKTVQSLHPTAKQIGIFSSGPSSLSRTIDTACSQLNMESDQRFEHNSNKF